MQKSFAYDIFENSVYGAVAHEEFFPQCRKSYVFRIMVVDILQNCQRFVVFIKGFAHMLSVKFRIDFGDYCVYFYQHIKSVASFRQRC